MNAVLKPRTDQVYIGGGNVAGILGVSPYRTPLAEYHNIIDGRPEESAAREEFFARRKALEPWAASLFKQKTGLRIVRRNHRFTDPEHGFLQAEVDFETEDGANAETKTVHPLAAKEWGEPNTDNCPVYVTAQAQHGLMISGKSRCYVHALIGFDDDRLYTIERDDELIAIMRAKELEFWQRIQTETPPEPTTGEDVLRMFARDNGLPKEADLELMIAADRLRELNAEIKEREAEKEKLADQVKVYLRDASILTVEGKPVLTWKSQDNNRFNEAEFKAAHPDLHEAFKRNNPTRVLRIK